MIDDHPPSVSALAQPGVAVWTGTDEWPAPARLIKGAVRVR